MSSEELFERAVEALAAGRSILLQEDLGRGGEGDVLIPAEFAEPAAINFMAREARGLIRLALSADRCDELGLEPIEPRGEGHAAETMMVSIEARDGVTTGISAADRSRTIKVAADPAAGAEDLVSPGHVFPIRAQPRSPGRTFGRVEAAMELVGRAGLPKAGVLCQVLGSDGSSATGEDLKRFADRFRLPLVSVASVLDDLSERTATRTPGPATVGKQMREVMGHFATGVTVLTSEGADGSSVGTTANAVCSVSLDPPLLLACLARGSVTLESIAETGRFAVNVLSLQQREHSDRFAAKGADAHAHEVDFRRHPLGVPYLPDALATIVCEVEDIHRAGDHDIIVGRARHLDRSTEDHPLIFYRGRYSQLVLEQGQLAA